MFDAEFRRQCDVLADLSQRAWGSRFLGRAIDRGTAAGTELTGYSDYTSGDDFRHIDWYRCSRHDELLSKEYRGREEQSIYLLLDGSRGMNVQGGVKFALAAQIAAALGHLAIAQGESVGVTLSGEKGPTTLPPCRGRAQLPVLLSQIGNLKPEAKTAGLKEAAEQLLDRRRKRGLTIVLTDFFDPAGYAPAIDLLRRNGYTPQLVQIYAPAEADPAWLGATRFDVVSTGRARRVRLDGEDLANYRQVFREFLAEVRGYCRRHSLGLLQTSSDATFDDCVRRLVRVSAARAAKGEVASSLS